MIVFFCQVYSQVVQDPFLFLFLTSAPVQSSFIHAAATNQHFRRLLGKRCACLTVSSRKWTHTDFSLHAQREIWSCASLISRTTEFEGKQAAFRLRTMLYCSGSCTQLIVWIPVLQAWHVLHEWARLFRHHQDFFFYILLIYSQFVTQQHSLCNCFSSCRNCWVLFAVYKHRLNACFKS